ncbi:MULTISPECIES: DUF4148 domain-containing protein [unclassified Achromobacter]|uniref:DUF4148 domain-containing protein n=1 Tax=unclassified Achromobacter TaxID=2626865 RepID=UPI00069D96F0|nr:MULTISPECIES: DUF4148 domain-containing protein [unclassified Achromobacter]KOF52866.1 hypothetical protein AD428_17415 [Achromobacter sp. DMS1]
MKTLASAALISLAALSASAFASSNVEPNNIPFQGVYGQVEPGTPSRAQVVQELQQAKANGQYTFGELDYPPAQAQTTSLTREQVREELAKAKANGEYTFGELDYPPHN